MASTSADHTPNRIVNRLSNRSAARSSPRWDGLVAATICVAFFIMVLLQAPGRVVADTKVDLYLDPVDLLHRATRLWESRLGMGYVPNQQWGYLFPMGPIFALGRALAMPAWLVHRMWLGALLIAAFLGCRRLAHAFGIGTPASRLFAATAYALAPSMLMHVGQLSAGVPSASAALPWIVVPLARRDGRRAPSTAAVASAAAFALCGSVNATVAIAALPFPVVYLLLREPGPRRRSLMRWWMGAIAATSLVFVVGVVLLGRYGFDFTSITEQASDTAVSVDATDVVRGTSDWLAYFALGKPWSPAGDLLVHSYIVVLGTGLVTALGIAGLARADLPERRCLGLTFGLGVAGQAIAFQGVWSGPFALRVQHLLDGPLSPLRNLSKLAPVVALPVALGLAHQLSCIRRPRWRVVLLPAVTVSLLAGCLPIVSGRLLADGSFATLPRYWRDAAAFLAADPLARTLETPSASFGEYTWGRTLDEPLQSIGRAPFVARALYPAGGSLATTRLLDTIDAALSRGVGVAGLAPLLTRTGIKYVLVRADLDRSRTGSTEPVVVAAALDASPGLARVRSFGPIVASAASADVLAPTLLAAVHAIEVYEVVGASGLVSILPWDPVTLRGGLESLLDPDLANAVGSRPVLVDGDALSTDADTVISDGLRLRDRSYGDARGSFNTSYTLGANELPAGSTRPLPRDLTLATESLSIAGDDQAHVTASSSFGLLTRFPEAQPYAAFDGDPFTSWMPDSNRTNGVGEWIQVNFDHPLDPTGMTVRLLDDVPWRPVIHRIRAVTANGSATTSLIHSLDSQQVVVPSGETTFLRLEIVAVEGTASGSSQVGLAEVAIPGLKPQRPLIVPSAPDGAATSYFFDRSTAPTFNPSRWTEEPTLDRLFTTKQPMSNSMTATASLRQPVSAAAVSRYTSDANVDATATSSWFGRSAVSAVHAVDGDSKTSWIADPFDPDPRITITWREPQTITGISVAGAGAPTRTPTEVVVRASGAADQRVNVASGRANLEPITTDRVEIEIVGSVASAGTASIVTPSAVSISELRFDGALAFAALDRVPSLACGDGPRIHLDGVAYETRPIGSVRAILAGDDVPLEVCREVDSAILAAGLHRLTDEGSGPFGLSRVALASPASTDAVAGRSGQVVQWGDTERVVRIGAGPKSVLSIAENQNGGWVATLAGAKLAAVRLDGWHQGWVVPAGQGGDLHLQFRPTRVFRRGLATWIIAVVGIVFAAWMFARKSNRSMPATTERIVPPLLTDALGAIILVLTGGLAVVMLPFLRRLRRAPMLLSVVSGCAFAFSTVVVAIQHDAAPGSARGAFSGLAQLSTLVAVGCVLAAVGFRSQPRDVDTTNEVSTTHEKVDT